MELLRMSDLVDTYIQVHFYFSNSYSLLKTLGCVLYFNMLQQVQRYLVKKNHIAFYCFLEFGVFTHLFVENVSSDPLQPNLKCWRQKCADTFWCNLLYRGFFLHRFKLIFILEKKIHRYSFKNSLYSQRIFNLPIREKRFIYKKNPWNIRQ